VLRAILVRWAVVAAAFAITAWLIDGVTISGGVFEYLWLALLFGIVNAFIGTIIRILTLPLTILTLGLFSIVVNALVLVITDSLSSPLQRLKVLPLLVSEVDVGAFRALSATFALAIALAVALGARRETDDDFAVP